MGMGGERGEVSGAAVSHPTGIPVSAWGWQCSLPVGCSRWGPIPLQVGRHLWGAPMMVWVAGREWVDGTEMEHPNLP